jgi:hypothetical protein
MIGKSAAICAMQIAAGWYNAKERCLERIGRPVNESVTSDRAIRALYRIEKNRAPPLRKRPIELSGAE